MQIWIIGRGIPSKENGMLGSFEYEQAQMLARHGYQVYYFVIDLRSILHKRKIGFVCDRIDGIHIVVLNIPIGRALPAAIRDRLYEPLRKLQFKIADKKYGNPDIVQVHYLSAYQYDGFKALQAKGAKIIGTEHWSKVQNKDLPEECQKNLQDFVDKADAITCVGSKLKDSIIELTKTKKDIVIVPNIASPIFQYKKQNQKTDVFRFLAVGRLSIEKGYDKLIQAFCKSFRKNTNVHLDIVGGGAEYDRLKALILQNNATEQVTLRGVMQREELSQFYAVCNVLAMPSDYETFGVPVIEAMSCGLPVIVTQNAGISYFVDKKCGIVIENNEVENISRALVDIYNRYPAFDRCQISEYARNHFGEESVFATTKKVYDRALSGEAI